MGPKTAKTSRKPRADSIRNRDRLLAAAREVFSAGGPDASLEAVARTAGVGIGTLYRHFPTREALFAAVYRREVDQLVELSERLFRDEEAVAALKAWLKAQVAIVATKRGMMAALAPAKEKTPSGLYAESARRSYEALGKLLDRAIAEGKIRGDVSGEELIRALVGMCYMTEAPGWVDAALRMSEVLVDGIRVQR